MKDKIASLFKKNAPKQPAYGRRKKLSKPKAQNIRNPFILKKKRTKLNTEELEIFRHFLKRKRKKKKEIREKTSYQ